MAISSEAATIAVGRFAPDSSSALSRAAASAVQSEPSTQPSSQVRPSSATAPRKASRRSCGVWMWATFCGTAPM